MATDVKITLTLSDGRTLAVELDPFQGERFEISGSGDTANITFTGRVLQDQSTLLPQEGKIQLFKYKELSR